MCSDPISDPAAHKTRPVLTQRQFEALAMECKRLRDEGRDFEDLCALLRDRALGKGPSIIVLSEALDLAPNEAKKAVHFSKAWEDRRAADEHLHGNALKALEQIQDEEPGS